MKRQRRVDAEKLTDEQLQQLSEQLGSRLREICDKACEEANRILEIYDMKALMHFDLKPKDFDNSKGE